MNTRVGIFHSPATAEAALEKLRSTGLSDDQLLLLTPRSITDLQAGTFPDPQPHGACGMTTGEVAGAITGFSSGTLGGAVVLLLVPGIGPILAVGTLLFGGLLGTMLGAAAGVAVEDTFATPPTYEDILIYKHVLRHGGNLLIVQPTNETKAETAEKVFAEFGAEQLDEVRERWWHRLRRSEAAASGRPHGGYTAEEISYLWGVEAALDPRTQGQSDEEAAFSMQKSEMAAYYAEPFRHGYEYGQARQQATHEQQHREPIYPSV